MDGQPLSPMELQIFMNPDSDGDGFWDGDLKSTTVQIRLTRIDNMASQGGGQGGPGQALVALVTQVALEFSANMNEYGLGDPISINFSGGPGNPTDRIELFSVGQDQTNQRIRNGRRLGVFEWHPGSWFS